MRINANWYVTIQLTPKGERMIVDDRNMHFPDGHEFRVDGIADVSGYDVETRSIRMQMWKVMHIFGPGMTLGANDTGIRSMIWEMDVE